MKKLLSIILMILILGSVGFTSGLDAAQPQTKLTLLFVSNKWTQDFPGSNETKLGQSVFGTQVIHRLNPEFEFELWGSFASNNYTDIAKDKTTFSALNDTHLRGSYLLGQNHVAKLSLLMNLPTGKKSLTDAEYLTVIGVSDNSHKFMVRRFGEGFDIGGEFLLTPGSEEAHFEIGGGYLVKGSYKVLQESDANYKFGNEFYGTGNFVIRGEKSQVTGYLRYSIYGKDSYDSKEVYQAGNALLIGGRIDATPNVPLSVGGYYLLRGKAKVPNADNELILESDVSARNELSLFGGFGLPFGETLNLLGRVEYKKVKANDYEMADSFYRPGAHYVGFGGGADLRFSPMVRASALLMYYTGKEADNNMTGLGASAGLVLEL